MDTSKPVQRQNRRGRPAALTAEQLQAVLQRHEAGEPLTEIAEDLGLHRNTLYRAKWRERSK